MDKEVDSYIEKQKSPQREILKELQKIIFKACPKIGEKMKWGVPSYGGCRYYIVALKDHVNMGFSIKGLSKKEQGLFQGSGKTMKHIEISSLKDIDEKKIVKLIKMVKESAH